MIDIVGKILELQKTKIHRSPMHTNRASMVGYYVPQLDGCLRRGVLERTKWQEKEMITPEKQLIFNEGNEQERIVLRYMMEAGINVIEQQSAFEFKEQQITGHLDCVVLDKEDGSNTVTAIPTEIKSASPHIFDMIHSIEDLKKKPWLRAYTTQLNLYLLSKGQPIGLFIFKNKSSGMLRQLPMNLDYELTEYALKACENINSHIKAGTLPDRILDVEICKDCPMKTCCAPGLNFGTELVIADDPMFEQRIDRYFELETEAKECKDLYELVKDRVKATAKGGPINALIGKYRIEGKPDAKGAFRFKIEKL